MKLGLDKNGVVGVGVVGVGDVAVYVWDTNLHSNLDSVSLSLSGCSNTINQCDKMTT